MQVMWRETVATVVPIEEDEYGFPSLEQIRQELETYKDRPLILGAFSAGSNVTGLLPPQEAITNLLHEHGGNIAWDFAGCGPYVKIDMNPKGCAKGLDAVFISPHKFIGGPGTPGVLVAKRHLLTNRVPNRVPNQPARLCLWTSKTNGITAMHLAPRPPRSVLHTARRAGRLASSRSSVVD